MVFFSLLAALGWWFILLFDPFQSAHALRFPSSLGFGRNLRTDLEEKEKSHRSLGISSGICGSSSFDPSPYQYFLIGTGTGLFIGQTKSNPTPNHYADIFLTSDSTDSSSHWRFERSSKPSLWNLINRKTGTVLQYPTYHRYVEMQTGPILDHVLDQNAQDFDTECYVESCPTGSEQYATGWCFFGDYKRCRRWVPPHQNQFTAFPWDISPITKYKAPDIEDPPVIEVSVKTAESNFGLTLANSFSQTLLGVGAGALFGPLGSIGAGVINGAVNSLVPGGEDISQKLKELADDINEVMDYKLLHSIAKDTVRKVTENMNTIRNLFLEDYMAEKGSTVIPDSNIRSMSISALYLKTLIDDHLVAVESLSSRNTNYAITEENVARAQISWPLFKLAVMERMAMLEEWVALRAFIGREEYEHKTGNALECKMLMDDVIEISNKQDAMLKLLENTHKMLEDSARNKVPSSYHQSLTRKELSFDMEHLSYSWKEERKALENFVPRLNRVCEIVRYNQTDPDALKDYWTWLGRIDGNCMSGKTGVEKIITQETNSSLFSARVVTAVEDIVVGDVVRGLDRNQMEANCTVEAIGKYGAQVMYGNYTPDHSVLEPGGETSLRDRPVVMHGKSQEISIENTYDVLTTCPMGVDESGVAYGGFAHCGEGGEDISWSDYILLHEAIVKLVRKSGNFWYSPDAYKDMNSLRKMRSRLCGEALKCAKGHADRGDCNGFEREATKVVKNLLKSEVREMAEASYPNRGNPLAEGSFTETLKTSSKNPIYKSTIAISATVASVVLLLFMLVIFRKKQAKSQSVPESMKKEPPVVVV